MKSSILFIMATGCALYFVAMFGVSTKTASAQGGQIPQGHQTQNWPTVNADPQRDSWVRVDPHISVRNLKNKMAGFGLLRKVKLGSSSDSGQIASQPIFEPVAGGYKSMGYVADAAGNAIGFDSDTSQIIWKTPLATGSPAAAGNCSAPNAPLARMTQEWVPKIPQTEYPEVFAGYAFGIEAGFRLRDKQPPAGGAVGEPHTGAVNIDETRAAQPVQPAAGPSKDGRGGGAPGLMAQISGGALGLAQDGRLRQLSLLKGYDYMTAPAPFLPANARAAGLIAIDNYVYAATIGGCGGAPDGIWAMDRSSPLNSVGVWKPGRAGLTGSVGPAFGTDGTIYVATGDGDSANGNYSASVVSLERKTLSLKDSFSVAKSGFATSPVVIRYNGRDLVAALNRDGKLYLLDGGSLGGGNHKTALSISEKFANFVGGYSSGALASWRGSDGTVWVLVPVGGAIAADSRLSSANGKVTKGAIVAFKVVDRAGTPSLEPGWVSRDMMSPLPPMVVNDVVFTVGSGEYYGAETALTTAQRRQPSASAVLYALDGATGAELWNSGNTLSASGYSGGLSSIFSTVFITTTDNTLWAFGFPRETQ